MEEKRFCCVSLFSISFLFAYVVLYLPPFPLSPFYLLSRFRTCCCSSQSHFRLSSCYMVEWLL